MKTHHSKNNNDFKHHRMKGADKRQRDFDYGGAKNQRTNYQKQQSKGEESVPAFEKSFPRKNLDPETVQYYTEISSLLEKSTTDTEERAILCSNALDESRGKEFQLVCDKVFSRLFENLISSCERDQLCQFLLRCIKVFPSISMDQSGSHVAEAALKSLALALQDCDTRTESHALIKEVLTNICQEVAENVLDIMCNQYGSHVLRSLLCLCNGTLLESLDKFHMRNNASTLASRLSGFTFQSPTKQLNSAPLQAFPKLLKFTVSKILEYSRYRISVIRADTFGGLVFQTILRLLKGDDEAVVKVITVLLDCFENNALKEGKMLEDASRQNVLDLMMDPASSHLMEVILEVAPGYIYMEILNRYFRHSLLEIATHKSGNFVVQSLISSSRDEGQCCRALAHAVNFDSASPNCIIPRILHLEDFSYMAKGREWQWPSGNKMSVLGCLMLQNIFSYPNDFIQQFCSSIASMEIDHILQAAKDPGGSRVIEAFLSSKAPLKHKLRVISKFRGHFGELAQQPFSSFTVSKCFLAADVALKEVIASELTLVQAELSRLKHGPHLLKTCDITRYSKGPEQWRSSQSSKQSTRQAFSEVFGSDVEIRQEDENGLVSFDEEVKEVVKKKGKNKRKREQDNIQSELEKKFLNKQGASKLENSMVVLGFDMHKQSKTNYANGKSRSNENESDNHRVKIGKTVPAVLEGDSLEKSGKDDIDEIFSKNSKTNKSITGRKVNEVNTNFASIVPDQACIDPSLSNVLNILERGSKKKKRGRSNDPSTSTIKKQKQGKQMVYI
ncbi:pumilio homolog 23 isoform X2 [Cryptomeria japonica]|uniref:pumilio homolog 23 isoform X2 n=1 Tax=Cryptomeria japonica TaxID=3369 RepID=UPI0027DA6361|nr:pumilio homolog 23 isoform X2 [Cryptomeria japonica]